MTILVDSQIKELCSFNLNEEDKMISPFIDESINTLSAKPCTSYGLSSAGYDVRLQPKFKLFTNLKGGIVDPLNFSEDSCVEVTGPFVIIPPNSYLLGVTIENFNIPKDIMVVCVGKSSLARAGLIINVTPIEPGFKGSVVIEISNATTLPVKVYSNMGIAQFLFFKSSLDCDVSYSDRKGKYQNQSGIQTPL